MTNLMLDPISGSMARTPSEIYAVRSSGIIGLLVRDFPVKVEDCTFKLHKSQTVVRFRHANLLLVLLPLSNI